MWYRNNNMNAVLLHMYVNAYIPISIANINCTDT